ncbi:hypothetical protein GS885_07360 [Rhodococcus hoagii]|nr:hypothetical protein [Prescottella equi]
MGSYRDGRRAPSGRGRPPEGPPMRRELDSDGADMAMDGEVESAVPKDRRISTAGQHWRPGAATR